MEKDEYYDYDDSVEEENNPVIDVLALVSKVFIYIGIGIAVILLLYFLITLKIAKAFLYIIGLVIAYFFGYFFMFFLDKFISNN